MQYPTPDRITHTTTFVTPVVEHWLEREIAQWVHPTKDRSDDPLHHERTLIPRSYISLLQHLQSELIKHQTPIASLSHILYLLNSTRSSSFLFFLNVSYLYPIVTSFRQQSVQMASSIAIRPSQSNQRTLVAVGCLRPF